MKIDQFVETRSPKYPPFLCRISHKIERTFGAIPQNTQFELYFLPDQLFYIFGHRLDTGDILKFVAKNAFQYFKTLKRPPQPKTLRKWSQDSVCKSLLGHKVEPDGYDHHGAPSWSLVLGLI
jgi:hypothetical protein